MSGTWKGAQIPEQICLFFLSFFFLTSTVYDSLREMKEDGDCKLQGEHFESANACSLLLLGIFQTGVVISGAL